MKAYELKNIKRNFNEVWIKSYSYSNKSFFNPLAGYIFILRLLTFFLKVIIFFTLGFTNVLKKHKVCMNRLFV